ncbi:RnfABCDGE type electron transport complex subunit G [Anaerosacchariphilus polymeriproducens]|uniref:Ion-translocating oxidoreductase complex subunit G n=1 Tax=Anaerosacchariphilus polymeriproducens TaxID=1812858 RepID=A0A371AU99_9FIRM|nr:RnfABCDGE type electron transport complex subunit G [Anaerosacchariphilus polymeriproducens]RDU23119.1 RnfABCDGE type electron transport complex subunit G [Anaerosacchariphilus polymeriproducens]
MNKIIKEALLLTIITLTAGLCLGFVYEITKAPIEKAQLNSKKKAFQTVFSDADSFKEMEINKDQAETVLKEAGFDQDVIDGYVQAVDTKGKQLGYVITVTSKEGYAGEISFVLGISLDGTVQGISILSISETAGLGMKAKTPEFINQFKDKKVELFKYTKNGASAEEEIDALSGATITTNAMTNGVNAGLAFFKSIEGGSVNE